MNCQHSLNCIVCEKYVTMCSSEDNSDNTDENTAMIEPHGDTPGGSTDPTVHTKQRTGDRVYSVASTRTIQGLMTEYKKRKKTKSMPTFVRATQSSRCSGLEHPGGFSSNSMSPQIEQEHRNSVMKVGQCDLVCSCVCACAAWYTCAGCFQEKLKWCLRE